MPYDHRTAEPRWQARWKEARLHRTTFDPGKPKFYALDMFPYPSGAGLHVGHCEGYTASDIITRWKRMQGWNVLHPMGWDAFGLPAENYAIKTGIHPAVTTEKAVANFRRQIDSIGFAYDWDREINTTDPNYYRWTQWIFLKLFEKGLAYEGTMPINWCPSCKTGLANEEVTSGKCERCGTQVVRKDLRQWILKITAYADRLLDDLAEVDWPESTLTMQRKWIGRSEGAEVVFKVAEGQASGEELRVFTTRPDTLFGATYMVLSPEHRLVAALTTNDCAGAVAAYQEAARRKSDLERTDLAKDKSGVFTGGYAVNPVNGEKIPIWIADYVLATYGTGAIMAVPAHDERDFAFARKFAIPIRQVVRPADGATTPTDAAFTGDGVAVNSGELDGLPTAEAKKKILAHLQARGVGKAFVNFRLRDWVFSRQRYWGEPIPIVHCQACGGPVPVRESDLPVRLPEVERYEPSGTGESPLANIEAWLVTTCPRCGGPARRETNTMPQWAGSCWYYLRYLDPHNDTAAWSPESERAWMNVDLYVGGAEHAVLHLLYARFWHKVLFDLGYVGTKEPFKKLRHQGTVLAYTYQDAAGKYQELAEVELRDGGAFLRSTGEKLVVEIEKMAKSKMNGVNPDDVVVEYGADVLRLYEMFMGEFELPKPWDPKAIEGCSRFLARLWRLVEEFDPARAPAEDPHLRLRHKTIKRVTGDLERMQFNTAIAAMMEFQNALYKVGATREDLTTLVKLVGPFAPHLGDEAWRALGGEAFLIQQAWPTWQEELALDAVIVVAVQVNGKLRANLEVDRNTPPQTLEAMALAHPNVVRFMEGKPARKVIVVPGRIVNVVI
jgi:leucyl-tRNA synthetase